jgi:hypothetical protein
MQVNIITSEDLQEFKAGLLEEIRDLFHFKTTRQKLWLSTSEVTEFLGISQADFKKIRQNHALSRTRIQGTFYYNYKDIEKIENERQQTDSRISRGPVGC